jgi:DNA-binding XRE family transcriptional regulator
MTDADKKVELPELALKFQALRKSLKRTQIELSKDLSVKQSSIAQWENNTYKPPAQILLKLAEMAPESERQWWKDKATERAVKRAGINWQELNTPGAEAPPSQMRRIPLIKKDSGGRALNGFQRAASSGRFIYSPA